MIAPVYGHKEPNNPETGRPKYPIAILQLINKSSHKEITDYDVEKFDAI